jgi:hypothetical protein
VAIAVAAAVFGERVQVAAARGGEGGDDRLGLDRALGDDLLRVELGLGAALVVQGVAAQVLGFDVGQVVPAEIGDGQLTEVDGW